MADSLSQIFLVRSSAGTGKTYHLTEQFFSHLIHWSEKGGEFSSLLAITFTKEAARNMRKRILQKLKESALKGNEKALNLVEEIIHNYSDFHIHTIDSFLNSLLTISSPQMGLSPQLKIEEEVLPLMEETLGLLLNESGRNEKIREGIENFISGYMETGTPQISIKKSLLERIENLWEKENIKGKKTTPLPRGNLRKRRKEIETLSEKLLIKIKEKDFSRKKNLIGILNKLSKGSIEDAIESTIIQNPHHEFLENLPPSLLKDWENLREKVSEWVKFSSLTKGNSHIQTYLCLREEMEKIQKERGIVFLDEIGKRVYQFTHEVDAPFLYFLLGERFRYFFIDEFQDTSIIQWENIYPLIEESLSQGGEVLCVGDVKQAIYQWRGGEVTLFSRVKDKLGTFGIKEDFLKKNYRSRKEILSFVNKVFSLKSLIPWVEKIGIGKEKVEEAYKEGEFDSEPGMKNREGGYILTELVEGNDNEEIEEKIKGRIKEILKDVRERYNNSSICILVRENKEAEKVTEYLLEEGIPVASTRTLNVRSHPLSREIISFLYFLDTPSDNLHFASFITGEIFLKATGIKREEIEKWIMEQEENSFLYRKFQEWKKDIWENFIDEFFRSVGFLPLYELLSRILKKFNVWEIFEKQSSLFMKLLELATSLEKEGENILNQFLQYWEEKEEENFLVHLPKEVDAIRVMTIHKAKGLEFPVVIIPFAKIEISSHKDKYLTWEDEKEFHYIYHKNSYEHFFPPLKFIMEEKKEKMLVEELNVFYVGITRASEEIYILLPQKKKNLAIPLLLGESKKEVFGKKLKRKTEEKANFFFMEKGKIVPWEKSIIRHKKEIDFLEDEIGEKEEWGEKVHLFLSRIKRIEKGKENLLFEKLREEGMDEKIEEKIKSLIRNEKVNHLFYEGEVYTEREICNENGELYRIDRLVINRKKVEIVEFKTGSIPLPVHYEQLKNYMELVKKIYPDKEVSGYLVFLGNMKIEEVRL